MTIVKMVEQLRDIGVDITMESYPYTAGMTNIASGIFMGDLQTVQSKFPNVKMPEAMQWLDSGAIPALPAAFLLLGYSACPLAAAKLPTENLGEDYTYR